MLRQRCGILHVLKIFYLPILFLMSWSKSKAVSMTILILENLDPIYMGSRKRQYLRKLGA